MANDQDRSSFPYPSGPSPEREKAPALTTPNPGFSPPTTAPTPPAPNPYVPLETGYVPPPDRGRVD